MVCAFPRQIATSATMLAFLSVSAAMAQPGVTDDVIVFGQSTALGGPAAALGQGMKAGILAAFEEANRKGGVDGRTLRLKKLR